EVSVTMRTREPVGEAGDLDVRDEALWIHLRRLGREDRSDAFARQQVGVAHEIAGIALEVLAGRELRRVHEDREHALSAALLDETREREVPLVQRAHRRHEAELASAAAEVLG